MTKTWLLRSAAFAACAACTMGQAQAQSAQEFWRQEWQRQHAVQQQPQQQPQYRSQGSYAYASGDTSAPYRPYQQDWSPFGDDRRRASHDGSREEWGRSRAMPQAHVDNPDFMTYAPDRPQAVSLAKACPSAADGANAAANSDFAKACGAASSMSMKLLPPVGEALTAYYSAHPQFIWVQDGKPSPRALAAIAALKAADKYGLDPADYAVPLPQAGDDAKALLRFEFALSARMLTYTLDATRGRVDPNRISGYHDLPRKSVDLVAALSEIAKSDDVAAALAARNPDNPQFKALVAELEKLRSAALEPAVRTSENEKELKGGRHSRKSKTAARDGDKGTAGRIEKIEIALEQLRWLPREFPSSYLFLNEPAFEVTYFDQGKPQLAMRAVVGKATAQTYFFVDHVKDVEYNPYWNVPRSIVINEMLPHLYRDPGYLDSKGYEVANQRGRQIASNSVNWAAVAGDKTSVEVRQPPGDRNALGRVKIEFPNKHAIYLHDTPEKSLFTRDMRALSHGCVRLQHPREMAAAVLGTTVDHIDKRIATRKTDKEFVKRDLPIYLVYFTAWPDQNGTIKYYDDVYDRDAHVKIALDKTEAERKGD